MDKNEKIKNENCFPCEDELYDLAELFHIFGDSTRIRILFTLLDREMIAGDIAEVLGMTASAVSHQLRILKASRLVGCRRQGKEVIYFLADDHVKKILSIGIEHLEEK